MAYITDEGDSDFYAVLAVPSVADEETIRQAYRRLAREYHPDVAGDQGAETMKRINAAYRVLGDPVRRREYDQRRGQLLAAATQAMPKRPHQRPPASPPKAPTFHTRTDGPFKLYRQFDNRDGGVAAVAFARGAEMLGIGLADGRVELWHLATQQRLALLNLRNGEPARPGVLQELRLSPSGNLAMAWGLNLGTRVWNTTNGVVLWTAAVNAPSGTMDGVLLDQPAMVRLALPAAPLALAEEDPFHWAEVGRLGTDVLTRPLERPGSVSPTWAVPLHCEEPITPRGGPSRVRVHQRTLAADGETLVTFSTGPASAAITNASIVHLWNLRQFGRLGSPGPQRQGSIVLPVRALWYPMAVAATATVLATQFEERAMRLYDLRSGQHLELPTGPLLPETRCALSADGALLALAIPDQQRVELWATASGQRLQAWTTGAPVNTLSFAGTGGMPTLAIGRNDGTCEVYAAG